VKIKEIQTTPIINVLHYGRAATKEEMPNKRIIVLAALLLSLAFIPS
jgi:hypothetical protein